MINSTPSIARVAKSREPVFEAALGLLHSNLPSFGALLGLRSDLKASGLKKAAVSRSMPMKLDRLHPQTKADLAHGHFSTTVGNSLLQKF